MVYDNTFKKGVANKEKYVSALWTHLQANFCHYTLTSKVKVERFGGLLHVDKDMTDTLTTTLEDFGQGTEAEISNGAHLVAYLGYQDIGGFSGLAWVGTACQKSQPTTGHSK